MKRLTFIFLIALCACTTPIPTQSETMPAESNQWLRIRMIHSGGIMGLLRTIEISNSGSAIITDDRPAESKALQLSTSELIQLNELISSVSFSTQAPRPTSVCADCFIYAIELDTEQSKTLQIQVDDTDINESGFSELVSFLRVVIEKALAN